MSDNTSPLPAAAEGAAPSNLPEYSVGELSGALKRTLEDAFGRVRVRGEISGFKRAGSGHLYFALKDDQAVIDAVCWRGTAQALAVAPEDGLEVICTGRITTYPARSRYQLVVESVELAGEGALLKLLEDRKRRLAEEGLFDEARKQRLPYLPRVIGVVTSPTGAVIRDILHRLADRFPRHVLLWPVLVQGDGAAEQVAAAIRGFNAIAPGGAVPRPDLLIVARGGGSLEDLWAFNEEVVVRAAAESEIPLISAVGHETDVTLIDFASDRRAPTPTAAAEMAVPVRAELLAQVLGCSERLVRAMARLREERRRRLDALARVLGDPRRALEGPSQRLDRLAETLERSAGAGLERRAARVAELGARIVHPKQAVENKRLALGHAGRALDACAGQAVAAAERRLALAAAHLRPRPLADEAARRGRELARLSAALDAAAARALREAAAGLDGCGRLLDSLSFERVLDRGFALVRTADGTPVTARAQTRPGLEVALQFHDGEVGAAIAGGAPAPKPRRRGGEGGGQGSLL